MKKYQHSIIDAHHHFWDPGLKKNHWLLNAPKEGNQDHLGNISALRNPYMPSDLIDDIGKFNVTKSVHVQAGWERSDLTGESNWLLGLNKKWGFPDAVVAYADLSDKNIESNLEKLSSVKKVKGIRQILSWHENPFYSGCEKDYTQCETWKKNFNLLSKYGFSFDMQIYPEQVDNILPVLDASDNTSVTICHCLMPRERSSEYLRNWKNQLRKLSTFSNVTIKISGIAMFDHNWNDESFKKIIHPVIEIFSPARCMFGSNFPIDKLYGSYESILTAYLKCFSEYSADEQNNILYETARAFYRL